MLLVAAARRRRDVVDRAIALDAEQLASVRAVGLHIARSIRSPEQPSWVSNSRPHSSPTARLVYQWGVNVQRCGCRLERYVSHHRVTLALRCRSPYSRLEHLADVQRFAA